MPEFRKNASMAYAQTFFEARRRLPNSVLPDLFNFIERFINNPASPGLNYERLAAMDATLRSARINRSYRAIIKIPDSGHKNVYTLLWVDSHDAAYDWAKRKRIRVNSLSNAVEIYDVIEREEVIEELPLQNDEPMLFDHISNQELEQINITSEFLIIIRMVRDEEHLRRVEKFLPKSIYECLSFLAAGFPYDEVAEMVAASAVDEDNRLNDYEDAILDESNRNSIYVVRNDSDVEELKQILNAPLEEWRIFLHPLQEKIVEQNYSGPARILGRAGTGKTIVAMHRANWLAEKALSRQNGKILFTTFTINLAKDIEANLKKLCSQEAFYRIEVVNIDKWIADFMLSHDLPYRLVFGDELKKIWERALESCEDELDLPLAFYIDEYERIILANEVSSYEEYKYVNRTGRGIPLNRSEKYKVWNVIESYRDILNGSGLLDTASAAIKVKEYISEANCRFPYKSIIVDEGQDFGAPHYRLLRAIAGAEHENDIFIVGDAHQRIYGKKVVLKSCGINITGRSGILKVNYRTTGEISKLAEKIINGLPVDDLDDGIDEGKGSLSLNHGNNPIIVNYRNAEEENEEIYQTVRRWKALNVDNGSICIITRTKRRIGEIRAYFREKGMNLYEIKAYEDNGIQGVRITTMHRVKGLEFDKIIVAGINDGVVPLRGLLDNATDPINKKELFDLERSLLYVAITRAKKELILSSYGKASELIGCLLTV